MSVSAFDRLVEQEQKKIAETSEPFDALREKEEWLQNLFRLHTMVIGFLKSYTDAGQVSVSFREVTLNEEQIGVYSAREMVIKIGTKSIRLEPVGALLIGSKGRVDVVGPSGTRAFLVLLDSRVKRSSDMIKVSVSIDEKPVSTTQPPQRIQPVLWEWKLLTRPPERRIVELTREEFLNLLTEIANG